MKIALCAIAKNENLYIREWIEWYKKLGISKIFLYDNNELDGERFEDVISDYIKMKYVEVYDVRGYEKQQMICSTNCYNEHHNEYDWMCFFDLDEFLYLQKDKTIQEYLSRSIFSNYNSIAINWVNYGDSNLIGYENNYERSCLKRFTTPIKGIHKKYSNDIYKKILRCSKDNISLLTSPHTFDPEFITDVCNSEGKKINGKHWKCEFTDNLAYIKHFCTKTILEYILKVSRGGGVNGKTKDYNINTFFLYNETTEEKKKISKIFSYNELNFLIINYNTPYFIESLLKSIKLHIHKNYHIYIFDNSDKAPCISYNESNITIFDNTNGKYVNFLNEFKKYSNFEKVWTGNNHGSAKHTLSIQKCFDLIPEGFVLLDSDILLKKDISDIIDYNKFYTGSYQIMNNGTKRLAPYICFINVPLCKLYGINYFDGTRMLGLKAGKKMYDTGASFYEDAVKYPHTNFNYDDYIIHFGQGSWEEKANKILNSNRLSSSDWIKNYAYLWNDDEEIFHSDKLSYIKALKAKFPYQNFENPQTIGEKINWLKIYDVSKLKGKCADKIQLHEYCKEKLGKDICAKILKIYDSPKDIVLDELPNQFVLKCNHGYKMNIVCKNKKIFNIKSAIEKCTLWLNTDFGKESGQLHYSYISPKCYVEEYLSDKNNQLTDYKFLCFNGVPKYVQVISERDTNDMHLNIYDMNYNFTSLSRKAIPNNPKKLDDCPKNFELMKNYAKILSKDFAFVRVDFYEVNKKVYLGELTFTPGNGYLEYRNKDDEKLLGNLLYIDKAKGLSHIPSVNNKILLCCIVKSENNYIEEWVKHYQNIGVSKIVIYDNDDVETEYIENVPYVKQLIDSKYIDVYHIPNKVAWQKEAYTECYQKYNKDYDWLMFFDVDEYLILENAKTIEEELAKPQFVNYDMIHVNWKLFDDNNLITCNGKYSVVNRFTHPLSKNLRANKEIKSIIRGGLEKIEFTLNPHTVTNKILNCCNPLGNKLLSTNQYNNNICHKEMWLNHYICKTAEEFISIKLKRLGGSTKHKIGLRYNIDFFFLYNEKTPEKIEYFKKEILNHFSKEDAQKILNGSVTTPAAAQEEKTVGQYLKNGTVIKVINKPTTIKRLETYKLPIKSIKPKY